jgi:hypothetical protein
MPSGTYIALATFVSSGNVSSVTFANIPGSYRDLVIHGHILGNQSNGVLSMSFNGDSTNRTGIRMWSLGSSLGGDSPDDGLTSATIGTNWGNLIVNIMEYSTSTKHKLSLVQSGDGGQISMTGVSRWASNSPITSITISSNRTYQANMRLSLYGVAL